MKYEVYVCICVCVLPPAPFQNALKPSSLRIFLKQSMTPLYVVWPARAATWSLVLMTSAGVTKEAAGTPCLNKTTTKKQPHHKALSLCYAMHKPGGNLNAFFCADNMTDPFTKRLNMPLFQCPDSLSFPDVRYLR